MYNYSPLIRRVMHTTNAIEAFHRQQQRVTKTKGAFGLPPINRTFVQFGLNNRD